MWDSDVNRAVVEVVDPRPGDTVVDIGAGFGPAVVLIARRGGHAIGVEPTASMRRTLGGRRLVQRARGSIEVVDGAAESIPVADGSVTAVMTVNTMHHWSDAEAAVAEIGRVLEPGGRVVLVDEAFDDPSHASFDAHAEMQHHHEHEFLEIDPAEMAEKLQAAGFTDAVGDHRRMGGAPVKFVYGVKSRLPPTSFHDASPLES